MVRVDCDRDRRDSPSAFCCVRSWTNARIGATPVPGPTSMMGTLGSEGSCIVPRSIRKGILEPGKKKSGAGQPVSRQNAKTQRHRGTVHVPGSSLDSQAVHTPFRGSLSRVLYLTIATANCIVLRCTYKIDKLS